MGIFTRLKDIIGSNINTMLDRAEDPEKMIRLMVQEMEDTLVEIKAACAGAMATVKKIDRGREAMAARARDWEGKAGLAVEKGREDLAREALRQRRLYVERGEGLERELAGAQEVVAHYQEDISQLEAKLATVREKQRVLIQRQIRARHKRRAEEDIRRAQAQGVILKFEQFESRVDRLEAEAELVNHGSAVDLEEEFARLKNDDEIELELKALKQARGAQAAAPKTPAD